VIVVSYGPYIDMSSPATEVYSTPLRLGGMRILSMKDTQFNLTPYDPWDIQTPVGSPTPPIAFVFDLATRQWVNPAPNPTEHGKIYDQSLEDDPIGKMLYCVNYWRGSLDQRLGVYAGHINSDPAQGLILVRESIVENEEPKYRFTDYQTPTQIGALRIISEVGGYLTLRAADGSLLYFDLATRQWVSSTSVATSTPYLTPTPEAPLPSDEVYKRENSYAGTATRIAQLTHVPTWPPGHPRIYPTILPKTPFSPIATRVAGVGKIVESGHVGDLSTVHGVFANQWRAEVAEQNIHAYAGIKSLTDGLDRGVVVIRVFDRNRIVIEIASYETPQRRGVVKVVDAVDQRLTLRAEDGTLFYFDIPTRQWVSPPSLP